MRTPELFTKTAAGSTGRRGSTRGLIRFQRDPWKQRQRFGFVSCMRCIRSFAIDSCQLRILCKSCWGCEAHIWYSRALLRCVETYICIHMHMHIHIIYICIYIKLHIHIYIHIQIQICIYRYTYTNIHIHIPMITCTCTYTHTYIYIYIHIQIHVHIDICIYICIHMHTYMHKHRNIYK